MQDCFQYHSLSTFLVSGIITMSTQTSVFPLEIRKNFNIWTSVNHKDVASNPNNYGQIN